jgi:hypothetical protein
VLSIQAKIQSCGRTSETAAKLFDFPRARPVVPETAGSGV